MEYFINRDNIIYYKLGCNLFNVRQCNRRLVKTGGNVNAQDLLYWVIIGILVGALLVLVGNSLITKLIEVQVKVKPG